MNRVFVSSTFRDMNYERDIIQERVLPELNAIARENGESIGFCDLRWGVNTAELESEEGSKKVLSVCLDEIDGCKPYMVVLLGERYGWIPSEALISGAVENRRGFTLDELEKSVTALEIEYGALRDPAQLERVLFYFRELSGDAPAEYRQEDEHHRKKLDQLKRRILAATGGRVKTYQVAWDPEKKTLTGLDAFAEMVTGDLRSMMEPEWAAAAKLTPYQKDLRGQWEYARIKARQFSAREDLIRSYVNKLEAENLLVIKGRSGSGKSTLMSRLALVLEEQGKAVLPVFCGSTLLCGNTRDILKYVVDYMETVLGLPHFPDEAQGAGSIRQWQKRLTQVMDAYAGSVKKDLVILVDAADQLAADEDREKLRFIPDGLSRRVKLVVSCLEDFEPARELSAELVAPLAALDREAIIGGILDSLGRGLAKPVIRAMVEKPGSDNPLYLSLLVQRLVMMDREDFARINAMGGGMDEITAHQIAIVAGCARDLGGLCVDILREAARKLGGEMAMTAARYLAVSRYGLRQSDLEGVSRRMGLGWNALDFARFLRYMGNFFFLRDDGRYDFTHKSFRAGLLPLCDEKSMHQSLADHFLTLDAHDPVRVREITYHMILADAREQFTRYVTAFAYDKPVIVFAARDAADRTMTDGGAWMTGLLRGGLQYGAGSNVVNFMCIDFRRAMPQNQTGLQLCAALMAENCAMVERLKAAGVPKIDESELAISHEVAGVAYRELGGLDNLSKALEFSEQALENRELLLSRHDILNLWRDLSTCCFHTGDIYLDLGGAENLRKALAHYERALAIDEDLAERWVSRKQDCMRSLMLTRHRIGDLYRDMRGDENLCKALELYEKALELGEVLARQVGSDESKRDLFLCLDRIGNIYRDLGDAENLRTALAYYERSLALMQELDRNQRSQESKGNVAICLGRIGNVYQSLGGEENLRTALTYQEQAMKLRQELDRIQGTGTSKLELSISYNSMASIWFDLGGAENLTRALEYYQRCLSIREKLAETERTESSKRSLSVVLGSVAKVYQTMGGEENLRKALAHYRRSLVLDEGLLDSSGTRESERDLAITCSKLGQVYRALGGKENLRMALSLLERSVTLWEELDHYAPAQANRCTSIGDICKELDEPDKACRYYERALALREELLQTQGTAEAKRAVTVVLEKLGNLLYSMDDENCRKSLEYFERSLAIAEELANTLGTVSAYDDLGVSLYKLGAHVFAPRARREQCLQRMLKIAKLLYHNTGNARYQQFDQLARKYLKKLEESQT